MIIITYLYCPLFNINLCCCVTYTVKITVLINRTLNDLNQTNVISPYLISKRDFIFEFFKNAEKFKMFFQSFRKGQMAYV